MNLKNSTRFFLSLVCALTLAACGQNSSAPDAAADAAALATAAGGWEKAYNEKDADAMASLYTEDGQLLPPGAGELTGRDAIRAYFANDIEKQWAKISIRSDSSGIGGDWAWRSGSWSVETTPIVTGKYAEVWRRTADGWRLHKDIWNLDSPPNDIDVPEITVN
jgi:ketosteroid isomerase-like protein